MVAPRLSRYLPGLAAGLWGSYSHPHGTDRSVARRGLNPKTAKFDGIPSTAIGDVERVRSQFLSLRQASKIPPKFLLDQGRVPLALAQQFHCHL
jgi:hypothetical protein